MTFVCKAAFMRDLQQRFFGRQQLHTGGLQLDQQPEIVDGTAGAALKILFQLGLADMKLIRQILGGQAFVVWLLQGGYDLKNIVVAAGRVIDLRIRLQIQTYLMKDASQQGDSLGHRAVDQNGKQRF